VGSSGRSITVRCDPSTASRWIVQASPRRHALHLQGGRSLPDLSSICCLLVVASYGIAVTIKKHGRRTVIMYDNTRGNSATGRPLTGSSPAHDPCLVIGFDDYSTRVRGEVTIWNTVSYGREITNDVPTQSS